MNEWQTNGSPTPINTFGQTPPNGQGYYVPAAPATQGTVPGQYSQSPIPSVPYQGGVPVRCPQCSNIGNARYCAFCGLDLSAHYSVQYPAYGSVQASSYSPTPTPQATYSQAPSYTAQMPSGMPTGVPLQAGTSIPSPQSPVAPTPGFTPPPVTGYPQWNAPNYPQANYNAPVNGAVAYGARKKNPRRTAFIVGGISLAAILLFWVIFFTVRTVYDRTKHVNPSLPNYSYNNNPVPNGGYHQPEGISLEEYLNIREGMSYAQVSQIIGGDGQEADSGTTPNDEIYYTYAWYGEDVPDAIVYITFVDSAVTEITSEGLTSNE